MHWHANIYMQEKKNWVAALFKMVCYRKKNATWLIWDSCLLFWAKMRILVWNATCYYTEVLLLDFLQV